MDSSLFVRSPMFACDCKLNVANCSLVKLLEFAKHRSEFQHDLCESFRYLQKCDISSLIDKDQETYGKLAISSPVALFRFIQLTGVGDGSTLPKKETIVALFSFIKRSINELRTASMPSRHQVVEHIGGRQQELVHQQHRRSIVDGLHYIKHLFYDLNVCEDALVDGAQGCRSRNQNETYLLASTIINELKNLCNVSGRLVQFLQTFRAYNHFVNEREQPSAFFNYFHAVLQIWTTMIEVSFVLTAKQVRYSFADLRLIKESVGHCLFDQSIRIVLYDILALSLGRFSTDTNELLYRSPFVCGCFMEVIIMLNHLVSNIGDTQSNDINNTQSSQQHITTTTTKNVNRFYELLFETLKSFDVDDNYNNSDVDFVDFNQFKTIVIPLGRHRILQKENAQLFPIWIFANTVPLLSIEMVGETLEADNNFNVTFPAILMKIYRNMLKEFEKDKDNVSNLSTLLIFTLKIVNFLSTTCFEVVMIMLDYFLKRLNTNFGGRSTTTVEGAFGWLPKNSSRWLLTVTEMSMAGDEIGRLDLVLLPNDGHFRLFLTFLVNQLKRLFDSSNNIEPRLVTTTFQRFLSKIVVTLQPRLLQSLDTIGVYHLGTFFLAIIKASSLQRWSEMIDKTLNVFSEIHKTETPTTLPSKSSMQLWLKFLFACLTTQPSTPINQKVANQIGKIVARLITGSNSSDSANRGATAIEVFKLITKELNHFLQADPRRCFYYLDSLLTPGVVELTQIYSVILWPASRYLSERRLACELCNDLLEAGFKLAKEEMSLSVEMATSTTSVTSIAQRFADRQAVPLVRSEANSDEDLFASLAFNVTMLTAVGPKASTLPVLVNSFLSGTDKLSTFQLAYLCLMFEDYHLLSKLRETSTAVLEPKLLPTWLRMVTFVVGREDSKQQEQLDSFSVNLFEHFLGAQYQQRRLLLPTEGRVTALDYYKCYLQMLAEDFDRADGAEKSKQIETVRRLFTPLTEQAQLFLRAHNQASGSGTFAAINRIFHVFTHLLNICHRMLYEIGKADCLLALVVERILIPSASATNFLSNEQCPPMLCRCFWLIYEALAKLCQPAGDSYLERKIRQAIGFYLPYLVANSIDEIKAKLSELKLYQSWCVHLYQVLEKVYLPQRESSPNKSTLNYLAHFCRHELSSEQVSNLTKLIFTSVNLMVIDVKSGVGHREALLETIVARSAQEAEGNSDLASAYIETIIRPFLQANIQHRPARVFELIRFLLIGNNSNRPATPTLFHHLCIEINRILDEVERRSLVGNHVVLRKLFKDFIAIYQQQSS